MTTDSIKESSNENGAIEVFLRIRPSEKKSGYFSQDDIDEKVFNFNIPKKEEQIVNNSRTRYTFSFTKILDDKTTQEDVFRLAGIPSVRNVLDGFNSTVFAYGQTGSGKTYTITGGAERYVDRGIIPRAISMLFAEFQKQKANITYTCYVSYLELYNESGYDLLNEKFPEGSRFEEMPKVIMLENEEGNFHFRNLSVQQVGNEEETLNYLFLGDTNRAIGETQMNEVSSRSHCIFSLMLEGRKPGSDTVIRSKLNLVDLAGSERVHKTNTEGQTLREAKYINSSLFFLEMVIVALHEKTKKGKENSHVPYRNSMMTSVLRDSLGGNCKTVMIATISQEAKQTHESVSTCNFSQRVALVKNRAYINEELEPALVIQRLKMEIKNLREEVTFLKRENDECDEVTQEQRDCLETLIKEFLLPKDENNELNIGTITLSKIQAANSIFKKLFLQSKKEITDPLAFADSKRGDDDVQKELWSLKKVLKQRDKEIKILVAMVREGRGLISTKENIKAGIVSNRSKVEKETLTTINQAQSDRDKLIPTGKICGVEKCCDKIVLGDASTAFLWFRGRYPGEKTIKENKEILQSKYTEAKDIGETVKKVKKKINYHKTTIEQLRREMAMDDLCLEDSSKQFHPEEIEHRSKIEEEKVTYKQAFERLRELKGSIEHIQRLIEKNRTKMQEDFDVWYREMWTNAGQDNACFKLSESSISPSTCRSSVPSDQSRNTMNPKLNPLDNSSISMKIKHMSPEQGSVILPPGIRLTGNVEADKNIIAFYKAKNELLLKESKIT